jgi:SAM-dependent methyltransferase
VRSTNDDGNGYGRRFDLGGASYDDAMVDQPDARREEFAFVVDLLDPVAGERILDLPAGGGQLAAHVPAGIAPIAVESAASFLERCRARGLTVVESDLAGSAIASAGAEAIVSVAGIHHEPDHAALLRAWRRLLVPGGRVVLADVVAGSAVAEFLDGFVADHHPLGHVGTYLGTDLADVARRAGWVDVEVTDGAYHWWFADDEALEDYAVTLFGLHDVPRGAVVAAAEAGPGLDRVDGRVGLRWGLRALTARTPSQG